MDFRLPAEITAKLTELDAFIDAEVKPLERDHMQFFDHRREYARTDGRTTAGRAPNGVL
jgi:acyl-CoA dehydrogenase